MRTATKIGSLTLNLALALALSAASTTFLAPAVAQAEDGTTGSRVTEDVVVLTDGRTITGRIVGEDDEFISIRSGGVLRAHAKNRVESVTRGVPAADPAPTPTEAGARPTDSAEAPVDPKAAKKAEKKRAKKAARDQAPARLSAEAQAWLTELLNRMRSPAARDPAVRTSLASALRAMGPTAVAPIRAAAADADPEIAEALKRTAAEIERGAAARRRTSDRAPSGDAMRDEKAGGARRRADVLASLKLSREQAREVKELVRDHMLERRDIYKEARTAGIAREEVAMRFLALRARTMESIRSLLDADQAEKFDAAADTLMETIESKAKGRGTKKKAKQKKDSTDEASQ